MTSHYVPTTRIGSIMIRSFLFFTVSVAMAAVLPGSGYFGLGQLAAQDSAEKADWVDLFDGSTLNGWVQRGGKANYKVEDGMIVGSTVPNTPNSFLCTERNYADFELQLEFKVDPRLNSGIQIRSNSLKDYKNGRVHGYQVEIDPNDRAWSCGIYDEGRRGWINNLSQRNEARYAFRQNQWNHYRILAQGNRIRTWINGAAAADLTDDMTAEGFIGLQVHGVGGRKDPIQVSWRNIKILELAKGGKEMEMPVATLDKGSVVKEGASVVKLADGFRFTEGPALGADGRIYFSDIPNNKIHAFDPATKETSVYRDESGKSNGLYWTASDALMACEGGNRRVTRQEIAGDPKVIVDKFEGKKFNSPNDITLDGFGGFYFTDPRYGDRDDMEMDIEGVYYVNPGRKVTRIIDDIERPNGIELSQDGKTLYVADTTEKRVLAYDVKGPGKVENKRSIAPIGCDGMTIDDLGNLYLTNGPFVHVYGADGTEKQKIEFPENPSNVTFGGPNRKTLFVTARTGFYSIEMNVPGGRAYANPELPSTK